MSKYLLLLMVFVQLSKAEKSFYAGRQPSYRKVLPKYTLSTMPESQTEQGHLDDRNGANSNSNVQVNTSTVFLVDSADDSERFLHRVSSWPAEKQPFWYRNREAIWQHINRGVDGRNSQASQPQASRFNNFRSPFAASVSP